MGSPTTDLREDTPAREPQSPPPRLPQIPGPWETAVLAWRWLRRMSTALLLLLLLAAASVVATLVPQEPLIPTTVADWRTGEAGPGEEVSAVFDALGFYDVYGTWWFAVLVVLLFVSLTGCLIPRWRAFARTVRRPPDAGRNLDRLSNRVEFSTDRPAAEAIATAERLLARRRFRRRRVSAERTDSGVDRLAAERGHWREGGSLVFHTAFYLLLAGAVGGQALGFHGQINIPEGSSFAETRIAYDLAEPGRYWGLEDHRGFVVTLDEFNVTYHDNFTAEEYVSTVTISEHGQPVRTEEIRVNAPLNHAGMTIYQARFGMAPRVVVRAGERVLFDEPVMMSDAGGFIWTGVAKVSMGDASGDEPAPQIALDLVLLPNAGADGDVPVSRSPEPENPWLLAELYVGEDLGLERPVPASQFDRDGGTRLDPPALLPEGGSAAMADGNLTIEFPELHLWSGFQVSRAPTTGLLLVAGFLILAGLIPSLYSYRRRLWVEAHSTGGTTRVFVTGAALQRKAAFSDEFTAYTDTLRQRLGEPRTGPTTKGTP